MSHTEGMTLCAEQRKAIRYACILDATANERTVRLGSGWVARVVDISTTGIGLHVGESLPAGALLTLDLEGRCHSLKSDQGAGDALPGTCGRLLVSGRVPADAAR